MKLNRWAVLGGALGVALAIGVGLLVWRLVTATPDAPRPTPAVASLLPIITVEAVYPGANAQVVADTLATPIEQQINGVEKMRWMRSQSRSDGTYQLRIAFAPGVDVDLTQVLVQNRVSLALPQLPEAVSMVGISVKKTMPVQLAFVVLSSPTGRYDTLYLTNYAAVHLKDDLARLAGISNVVVFGHGERSPTEATLNGKPVVLVGIDLLPGAQPAAVRASLDDRLQDLRAALPEGLELTVAFDFARNLAAPQEDRPEYLRLDLELPRAASTERTAKVGAFCAAMLRQTKGVQDVLTILGPPFSIATNEARILAQLSRANGRSATRAEIIRDLRTRLQREVSDAAVRLCDLTGASSFPGGGFPVAFAIEDRGDQGSNALRQAAEKLADQLRKSGQLTDVDLGPAARLEDELYLDIDRARAKTMGVEEKQIFDTLQAFLGKVYINDLNRFGRTRQVTVRGHDAHRFADFKNLQVRNKQGQRVRLGDFCSDRTGTGTLLIERYNMYPAIILTANPASGVALDDARKLCQKTAAQVLPASFQIEEAEAAGE
jgi:multidrug efflux pump subunit AcrB